MSQAAPENVVEWIIASDHLPSGVVFSCVLTTLTQWSVIVVTVMESFNQHFSQILKRAHSLSVVSVGGKLSETLPL